MAAADNLLVDLGYHVLWIRVIHFLDHLLNLGLKDLVVIRLNSANGLEMDLGGLLNEFS